MRTPTWAFAVGGLPETLRNGESGQLFTFGDTPGMAESIIAAARGGRLEKMDQAGAEFVRREFDAVMVARRYLGVYKEMIKAV